MTFPNPKQFLFATLVGAGLFFTGCADSSSTDDQANIQMTSELEQGGVGVMSMAKGSSTSGANEVDSLYVTRVRVLISDLKMHQGNDDIAGDDRTVKTGPFLIQFDSSGSKVFTNASVPAGSYDKIKFEIHKLSSSEVGAYLNDPIFQDFVTDDRYTVIIEGYVIDGGVKSPFNYRSKVTENIQVKFDPDIVLEAGATSVIALQFAPRAVFKKGSNRPLDPRDGGNHSEMEKAIKDALKALKKS